MRIASYNIKALRQDRAAVVAVLLDLDADVVGIQESTHWPVRRWRLARLARDAGLEVAVTGWGARETSLLVRPGLEVTGRQRIPLPWKVGRTRRGIAAATVAGVPVIVVHLSLDPAERQRHLTIIQGVLTRYGPERVVVVGDLNEEPGGAGWTAPTAHLTDAAAHAGPTFPSARVRRREGWTGVGRGVGEVGGGCRPAGPTRLLVQVPDDDDALRPVAGEHPLDDGEVSLPLGRVQAQVHDDDGHAGHRGRSDPTPGPADLPRQRDPLPPGDLETRPDQQRRLPRTPAGHRDLEPRVTREPGEAPAPHRPVGRLLDADHVGVEVEQHRDHRGAVLAERLDVVARDPHRTHRSPAPRGLRPGAPRARADPRGRPGPPVAESR